MECLETKRLNCLVAFLGFIPDDLMTLWANASPCSSARAFLFQEGSSLEPREVDKAQISTPLDYGIWVNKSNYKPYLPNIPAYPFCKEIVYKTYFLVGTPQLNQVAPSATVSMTCRKMGPGSSAEDAPGRNKLN